MDPSLYKSISLDHDVADLTEDFMGKIYFQVKKTDYFGNKFVLSCRLDIAQRRRLYR